ncbi:hypothetical protein PIB30_095769 [Stylosanthes scabra]|uniref:RNase H type-1 domain-containing protein n=1 Tax=Stylosanthes scabra TaxID=79078 RepID=A0ABU6QW06_9FABA|nr:hypothetical protein [Stylosanthes scabra]
MLEKIEKGRRGLFLCCLYAIWLERNKLLFENVEGSPESTAKKALEVFAEVEAARISAHTQSQDSNQGDLMAELWTTPKPGRYKLNVDAAVLNGDKSGVGAVIRDEEGVVVGAATLEIDASLTIREAEAMAVYLGINFALYCCFFDIEIELMSVLQSASHGAVYKVGDSAGWTIIGNVDYKAWASPKNFHVKKNYCTLNPSLPDC